MGTRKKHTGKRCPNCNSRKWYYLGQVPMKSWDGISLPGITVAYKCLNCNKVFVVQQERVFAFVESAERCFNCGSKNVKRSLRAGPDVELYQCEQCGVFMETIEVSLRYTRERLRGTR
jgi:predicted RNA-binding Zn-ribbon protein involved in translation (DUF1610 family)